MTERSIKILENILQYGLIAAALAIPVSAVLYFWFTS